MRGLVLATFCLFALSGCLNDFSEDRRNHLSIAAIDVAAPTIKSGSIDLDVTVSVDNRLARSGDLLVAMKLFSTSTGLLQASDETDPGRIGADKTKAVLLRATVPRDDGYRIEVEVWQDEQRHTSRTVTLSSLADLEPNVFETGLAVAGMDFLIDQVSDDEATIQTNLHLTNEGTGASRELRLQLKARELSTSLLADETWTDIGPIPVEETHIIVAMLTVPSPYNYDVEAVLWDGNVIVERGVGTVQLLPTIERPKDTEIEVVETDLRRFAASPSPAGMHAGDSESSHSTPGPAMPLLLAVLLAAPLAATLRRDP